MQLPPRQQQAAAGSSRQRVEQISVGQIEMLLEQVVGQKSKGVWGAREDTLTKAKEVIIAN